LIENSFAGLPSEQPDASVAPPRARCGAMVQQRNDVGYQSAPQKFVRLVGCRDSNVCLEKANGPTSSKR
jgi:hypothetical protein